MIMRLRIMLEFGKDLNLGQCQLVKISTPALETLGSHPKSYPLSNFKALAIQQPSLICPILTETDTFMFDNYPFIYS